MMVGSDDPFLFWVSVAIFRGKMPVKLWVGGFLVQMSIDRDLSLDRLDRQRKEQWIDWKKTLPVRHVVW